MLIYAAMTDHEDPIAVKILMGLTIMENIRDAQLGWIIFDDMSWFYQRELLIHTSHGSHGRCLVLTKDGT